jgi:hypothetical protein
LLDSFLDLADECAEGNIAEVVSDCLRIFRKGPVFVGSKETNDRGGEVRLPLPKGFLGSEAEQLFKIGFGFHGAMRCGVRNQKAASYVWMRPMCFRVSSHIVEQGSTTTVAIGSVGIPDAWGSLRENCRDGNDKESGCA